MKTEQEIKDRIENYNQTIKKLIHKRNTNPLELHQHFQAMIDVKVIKINLLTWVLKS